MNSHTTASNKTNSNNRTSIRTPRRYSIEHELIVRNIAVLTEARSTTGSPSAPTRPRLFTIAEHRPTTSSEASTTFTATAPTGYTPTALKSAPFRTYTARQLSTTSPLPTIPEEERMSKVTQSVQFKSTVDVRVYPTRTNDEFKAAWIQPVEYQQIRESCRSSMLRIKAWMEEEGDNISSSSSSTVNSIRDIDDGTCIRGLEWALINRKAKEEQRFNALREVLIEQEMQRCEGDNDPKAIAECYARAASDARKAAFLQGLKDERDANVDGSLAMSRQPFLDQHASSQKHRSHRMTPPSSTQASARPRPGTSKLSHRHKVDRAMQKPERRPSLAQKMVAKAA
mmetsp:Transcript_557/g.1340  ORF Transcript_557/g.1340 Transcript_557/m.1340 type:complete len:341 (-) Transcript_557:100-1122(-)